MSSRWTSLAFSRCQLAVLLVPAFLGTVPASHDAAPEVIILHGGVLATPVFITDPRETHGFVAALTESSPVSPQDVASRPHVDAALFWGMIWRRYARDSVRVRTLQPERAEQHARIYPARRIAEAPLFVYRERAPDARVARRISPGGIRILQQHQVPILIDSGSTR